MEALSCGTITIVTDLPVFTKHEQKDILFNIIEKGNANAISNTVIKLLYNKESLNKNKLVLREYFVNFLDLKVIANEYKLLFESLRD